MKRLFIQDSEDHITEAALGASAAKLIPAHSVLMVTRSGILAHTFPVAVNLVPVTVNQDLKALTPLAGVRDLYVAYGLQALGQSILRACSKDGTTVASVDTQQLKSVQLPVAPHQEQRRIVEAIESYLTRLDNAVALLERVEENLKRYRASVLKAAVEGRLVPTEAELARREGLSYEPASELLKRILVERKTRWIEDAAEKARAKAEEKARKAGQPWSAEGNAATLEKERTKAAKQYKEPAAPNTSDLPDLPEGWGWATVDAISEVQGGLAKGHRWRRSDELREVPYLRVANVQRGYLDLAEMKMIEATEDVIATLTLRAGDVLFNEGGDRDKLGRGWVWEGQIPECIHQNHVFRARVISAAIMPQLLSWYANTKGQEYFVGQGKQTTNLASISMTKLKSLPIPIPPPAEQRRLVAELEAVLSSSDALVSAVEVSRKRCTRLRQSILKWAFEGKLVEQDPNDEPASLLLERIKAERAAATLPKVRGRTRRSAE
jgi:type I restriction enzyme S subunit